jgi:hypothetical protein
MLKRGDLVFDTTDSGAIFIEGAADGRSEINILLDGDGTPERRAQCRNMLRMYDLGAKHKAEEIKKVLGVR